MQRAHDEVARERCLDADAGSLGVAHLADEDDVRILPQERSQHGRERGPRLGVDLDLRDAVEVVFDGVLDGNDIDVLRTARVECAVQCRALARAGRPRHEQKTGSSRQQAGEEVSHLFERVAKRSAVRRSSGAERPIGRHVPLGMA
jgi:hypothetical protein